MPQIFNVALLKNAAHKGAIYGNKAVGEPPLMLAISVREAIRDAVAAFRPSGAEVPLPSPATPEAIFLSIHRGTRGERRPIRDQEPDLVADRDRAAREGDRLRYVPLEVQAELPTALQCVDVSAKFLRSGGIVSLDACEERSEFVAHRFPLV